MKRIYLIDCPGVVPPSQGDSEEDILLRGVVRVENVEHPAQYVEAVLRRTQQRHIERTYEIKASEYNDDPIEFLSILARKGGRLLKGGEPDVDGVAKMVLNDFLRGKIPWFTPPPKKVGDVAEKADDATAGDVVEGREGRLGEMPGKGKRKADSALLVEPGATSTQEEGGSETDSLPSDEEEDEDEDGDDDAQDLADDFEHFDDEDDGHDDDTNNSENEADGGAQI